MRILYHDFIQSLEQKKNCAKGHMSFKNSSLHMLNGTEDKISNDVYKRNSKKNFIQADKQNSHKSNLKFNIMHQ